MTKNGGFGNPIEPGRNSKAISSIYVTTGVWCEGLKSKKLERVTWTVEAELVVPIVQVFIGWM